MFTFFTLSGYFFQFWGAQLYDVLLLSFIDGHLGVEPSGLHVFLIQSSEDFRSC